MGLGQHQQVRLLLLQQQQLVLLQTMNLAGSFKLGTYVHLSVMTSDCGFLVDSLVASGLSS